MDIKVLEEVPTGREARLSGGPKKARRRGCRRGGRFVDRYGSTSRRWAISKLLSAEQEVEIASGSRRRAGGRRRGPQVPVTLDFLIDERPDRGWRGRFARHLRGSEEPGRSDEERGPEANEKLLKKLHDSTRQVKDPPLRPRSKSWRGIARAARAAAQA